MATARSLQWSVHQVRPGRHDPPGAGAVVAGTEVAAGTGVAGDGGVAGGAAGGGDTWAHPARTAAMAMPAASSAVTIVWVLFPGLMVYPPKTGQPGCRSNDSGSPCEAAAAVPRERGTGLSQPEEVVGW